jgi:hypothetical protein
MSTRQTRKRIAKLERLMCPQDEGDGRSFTLEQLCWSLWKDDKKLLVKIAKNNSLQMFTKQFQLDEDAVAAAKARERIDAKRTRHRLD